MKEYTIMKTNNQTHWKMSVMCVVILMSNIFTSIYALPSSSLEFDPSRIFSPDEIDELRRILAFQECKKDPNCNANYLFGIPEVKCSLGQDVDAMMNGMIGNRIVNIASACNPFLGEVVWPLTGDCVTLLTQGPCPEGFWVKMKVPSLNPVCEQRVCGQGQALMENKCMDMQDKSMCPSTQVLMNNEFGSGECECAPGTIFYPLTNNCYNPYSQGPCPPGQVIKVLDEGNTGKAVCIPSPCPSENMVRITDQCQVSDDAGQGTCYFLETRGPCTSGVLSIDYVLLEPVCILQTETHSIFNLPNIRRCSRGSIRDSQGRCRRDVSNIFTPSAVVTSRPELNGNGGRLCPKGQLFLGGLCYRLGFNRPRRPKDV